MLALSHKRMLAITLSPGVTVLKRWTSGEVIGRDVFCPKLSFCFRETFKINNFSSQSLETGVGTSDFTCSELQRQQQQQQNK